MSSSAVTKSSNKLPYVVHGVAGLVALAFVMAGGTKLMADPMHVENFARWGYPSWFMYVTGLVEVVGAIVVLVPQTRFYGAVLLGCTMVGAVATHALAGEFGALAAPIILAGLIGFVAWQTNPLNK